ncbi:DUF305 domain-containing protein [Streptomyces indicus]|uniref:Uncharacterized conserved protein, DUF305 family n=1 Tax=Streptomyces indicus TaxID=417292 RepID=A0A1G8UE84_9ACTN|nr:DUF305 domain-containing protein [Streptomyces indicus]SDJ52042.1 Uncharacterized conserved protein, DUF305 family [Streptomyces indicus]
MSSRKTRMSFRKSSTRTRLRRAVAVAAAGAAAFVLAACGGSEDASAGHGGGHTAASPSAPQDGKSTFNAADVAFAQGMIPHHRQAVEMAELAPERARSAELKRLAEEIKKAQDPEIKTLTGWLTSWGEDVPAEGDAGHGSHGGGGGMMTAEEMADLEKASGEAFDTAFMELMIKHHEGAVAMAKTEQAEGAHGPAKKMAGAIITSQSEEIDAMNEMLGKS